MRGKSFDAEILTVNKDLPRFSTVCQFVEGQKLAVWIWPDIKKLPCH